MPTTLDLEDIDALTLEVQVLLRQTQRALQSFQFEPVLTSAVGLLNHADGDSGKKVTIDGTSTSKFSDESLLLEIDNLRMENIRLHVQLDELRQTFDKSLAQLHTECVELRATSFQLSEALRKEDQSTLEKLPSTISSEEAKIKIPNSLATISNILSTESKDMLTRPHTRRATADNIVTGGSRLSKMCMMKEHAQQITCIKFANGARTLAAQASSDGQITIMQITTEPLTLYTLQGHDGSVTDLLWNNDNNILVSVGSSDKTVRVWDTKMGNCLRGIQVGSDAISAAFYPADNRILVVGTGNGTIATFNILTGKNMGRIRAGDARITALQFNKSGSFLFSGDDSGVVTVWDFNRDSGMLGGYIGIATPFTKPMLASRCRMNMGTPITALFYQKIPRTIMPSALLLVNMRPNLIVLFSVASDTGDLTIERQYTIDNLNTNVPYFMRAALGLDSCLVAGSMENTLIVIDTSSSNSRHSPKDMLYGHGSPVICVAWNSDNSLLLSGDESGITVAWRRELRIDSLSSQSQISIAA